jgi:hypothetical protein
VHSRLSSLLQCIVTKSLLQYILVARFKGHVKFCDFIFTINEFDFSIINNKIYNNEYELNFIILDLN